MKYTHQFPFLSTMKKKTGPKTKQGPEEFSFQHCINIKRKELW